MGKVLIVTGIPGTGKTTVCNEVLKLAERAGKKVKVVNYGSIMVGLLQEEGKSMHRDDLRKSSLSFQRNLQIKAAQKIADIIKETDGSIIVDTHMSIKTADGYWPGLPNHVLQLIKPDVFVLVEAEPEEILSRRLRDKTRRRDKVLEEEIREELLFSRLMASACSVSTGASVKIVKNSEGKQVEAAKEIIKLLE